MRHHGLRLVLSALLASPAVTHAADDAASWLAAQQAAVRAAAAEQALSDRYTAIWKTLDAGEKSRFSARERAWLNEGRQAEQSSCLARADARTELVARTCEADVIERHLGALPAPQRLAVSG